MTAMSMIVQPQAAYLLTDTAFYMPDGTITEFGPKVTELYFGDIVTGTPAKLAFALQGSVGPDLVKEVLKKVHLPGVAGFLAAAPEIVRGITHGYRPRAEAEGREWSMAMTIALWDDATNRAYGFFVGNETCQAVGVGMTEPYKLVKMLHYVQQQGTFEFEGVEFDDPAQFDPVVDGGRLLDAQRLDPFGDRGGEFCGIAGKGMLTTISATGIKYDVLRNWPDKVGERIPVPEGGLGRKPLAA